MTDATIGVPLDAVVLAGGRGRRMGGADKAALRLGAERLVDRAVAAARNAGAARVVVVGPASAGASGALAVREDPPFSGPLAGLAAGLRALDAPALAGARDASLGEPPRPEWVLLLACDLADPAAVCSALVSALSRARAEGRLRDGLLLEDPDGRAQWLAGVYRVAALRAGLDDVGETLADRPLRLAFARAELIRHPAAAGITADIDTPEDLERARRSEGISAKERT